MLLLAEIRFAGGDLRLDANGGIVAKGLTPEMIEAVKANRKAVVAALACEKNRGIIYCDSALYIAMDRIYIAAKRLNAPQALMRLIYDADEAAYEGEEAFRQFVADHSKEIISLCTELDLQVNGLEGYELRNMVNRIFGLGSTAGKIINMNAFA